MESLGPKPACSTRGGAALRLAEDAGVLKSLERLIAGFTSDPVAQQDLLQECRVCLWQVEAEKPGRTRSWYLQNCRFCVQHLLAAGRSVDSPKRARGDARLSVDTTEGESALGEYHTDGELFEAVSFRDVVAALDGRLRPSEREVLRGLAEGLTLGEIALRSGLSYPTVLKYRRIIGALVVKLGIASPSFASHDRRPVPEPRSEAA
jgi:DNA-directed RNA polymerase specialized sigma24 family protein